MRITISLTCFLLLLLSASQAVAAPLSRPEINKGPTQVQVDIYILDIDEIDTANQSYDANVLFEVIWSDPRLKHKEESSVRMSVENIWHPKLQIVNRQRIWTSLSHTVEVNPDGKVTYIQRVWGPFPSHWLLRSFLSTGSLSVCNCRQWATGRMSSNWLVDRSPGRGSLKSFPWLIGC